MRPYCRQNDGDCTTCSLANYGRDCHNNPIRVCSKCGVFVDSLPYLELFGEESEEVASRETLCDECYARERESRRRVVDTTLGTLRREWPDWQDEGQENAADFHGNEEWPDDLPVTLYSDGSVHVRGGENQMIQDGFSQSEQEEFGANWDRLLRKLSGEEDRERLEWILEERK